MNILELLNPAPQEPPLARRLRCDSSSRLQLAAAGVPECAEAAAMSLMLLLGQHDESSSPPTPMPSSEEEEQVPLPSLTIAAGASDGGACAVADEGLRTPLPAAAATLEAATAPAGSNPTAGSSTLPSSAPHLSPIADKLYHIASWSSSHSPETSTTSRHARQPRAVTQKRREESKRARHESPLTPRLPSKIQDLFSKAQAAPSTPSRSTSGMADTLSSSSSSSRGDSSNTSDALAIEELDPPSTVTGQHCAVTGCLRVAQHMAKCAVHKGMKLCCTSGCFRPVQSRGFCKSHGGGARCKQPGCKKGAISKGRCRSHGGGTRCAVPSCSKWAQRFGCCVRHSKAFAATTAIAAAGHQRQ